MENVHTSVEPLQTCEETNTHSCNKNTISDLEASLTHKLESVVSLKTSSNDSSFGNEENVPENCIDNEERIQQPGQHTRLIKRMRMGGTPQKQESNASRNGRAAPILLEPSSHDTVSYSTSIANKTNIMSSLAILPTLHKAPSSDAGTEESSLASSVASRNWLDDFGKQNKANNGNPSRRSQRPVNMTVPEKDPRFHYKRKTQQTYDHGAAENAPPALFPNDPMEVMQDPQVFLAPVIVPPTEGNKAVSSPWKEAPTKTCQGFSSPAATKRSSEVEASHAAIAAAQQAPDLSASFSHDTASSSSHSNLTSSTTSSMASALVKRLMVDKNAAPHNTTDATKARLQRLAPRGTPVRVKPKVKPQDVQATDQGYASVAKLSAWLADDPTSTKKVRHVRRGANVIAKSRKFEKDLEDVIVEENNIVTGAVQEKKTWLKSAFSHDMDDQQGHDDASYHHDPNREMMMMRTQPVNFDDNCARSEFIVCNDAASSISVSNKKKWLEKAFKKEDGSGNERRTSFKARSDIGPVRESRDDITSRAKKLWQQKSEKRVTEGPPSSRKPPAPSPYRGQRPPAPRIGNTPSKQFDDRLRASMSTRASAPPIAMAKAASTATAASNNPTSRHSIAGGFQVEEDNTPVDFRAARAKLIQRSKENGNELKVASKVQRRTDKFEKINQDNKRRSSAMGLLKPTWESNSVAGSDISEGPSDAYNKAYMEDIVPQKSFDELP